MFEKVLFPVDFSHHALKIAKCLGEIPGIKEIVMLHVLDTGKIAYGEETETTLRKKAELELEEQKKRLESSGFKVEIKIKAGIPSREICRTAKETQVSLIVMGARGRSLIKDILLGSVTSDVVRYGKSNVLIMRYRVVEQLEGEVFEKYCDRIFSKILFPTDFSVNAAKTVSIIKEIGGVGEIVLVHAVDKGETQEELDLAIEEATRKLKEIEAGLADTGIQISSHVHMGNPAGEINKVAEEEDVSLIVMSSGGKGIIEQIRIGSTAENVVRNAKRPVLILRT